MIYRQGSMLDQEEEAGEHKRRVRVKSGVVLYPAQEEHTEEGAARRKAERRLSVLMMRIGLPGHMMGTVILRNAVLMAMEEPHLVYNLMHELYPRLASHFGTTAAGIERDLRSMISVAWERGVFQAAEKVLGPAVSLTRPTSGELIALLSERLRMELFD